MKKLGVICALLFLLAVPMTSHAIGLEFALGTWSQTPSGDLAYKLDVDTDNLDLDNELGYDARWQFTGRLKLDMPLLIPNVYVMATPMIFDGTGTKEVQFKFGDQNFTANTEFYSKITLTHYDVALYYGLPFVNLATAKMLNVDVGINVRFIDLKAEISQDATNLSESKSVQLPLPMVFVAAQLTPFERLSFEGEARGISYGGSSYYSLVGRVKFKVFGPLFATGGYRWDAISIDESNVDLGIQVGGMFFETGCEF